MNFEVLKIIFNNIVALFKALTDNTEHNTDFSTIQFNAEE